MSPVGFRFCPSDEDLLYYLRKKVKGEALMLPEGVVFTECDIYGDNKEPWNLFDKSSSGHFFYVFTRLNKKSKSRIDRVAGCGSWNYRTPKTLNNGGFRKYFVFKVKNDPRTTNWVMHEFSLADEESFVLCRVQNKNGVDDSATQETDGTDSCLEKTKKRGLSVEQEEDGGQRKKMRTDSFSVGYNEEEQLLQDLVQEHVEIGESGLVPESQQQYDVDCYLYEDSYHIPLSLVPEAAPALDENDATYQFLENLILDNPYSPQSNLITEAEQDIRQVTLSIEDYIGWQSEDNLMDNLLQSSAISMPTYVF